MASLLKILFLWSSKMVFLFLRLNFGHETKEIYVNKNIRKLNDGAMHKFRITYTSDDVQIEVDDCKSQCTVWKAMDRRGLLNVNGPLQLGGMRYKFNEEQFKSIWGHLPPTHIGFSGCIRNLTYNGFYYNLGAPSDQYHAYPDCNYGVMQAVTFGIDSNFLVAILVCVAILIIIVLVSFIGFCTAQVNFSPNWGKRALNPAEENENNCRENVDTVMLIYKIIQVCYMFFS
ncbi:hypothetical protein NQ318_013596 [Aromia moschata]|uniref:Laminin G domain-containing protein n=1 Tax=Aromia moschata TaxID=1265417 RepID=A0AAV8YJY1_9CUCU|nr:hypothetical protein NQ318_013596 [Aromia moschata]